MEGQEQVFLIDSRSAVTTCPYLHAAHVLVAKNECWIRCITGHIRHFGLKDVQCTTESGANLTLKYDLSDVQFPIASVDSWLCRAPRKKGGHGVPAVVASGSRAETPSGCRPGALRGTTRSLTLSAPSGRRAQASRRPRRITSSSRDTPSTRPAVRKGCG